MANDADAYRGFIYGMPAPLRCIVIAFIAWGQFSMPAALAEGVNLEVESETLFLTHHGLRLPVSLACPYIVTSLSDTPCGGAPPRVVSGELAAGETVELRYTPISLGGAAQLEARLYLQWSEEEQTLRKWLRYRLAADAPEAVIEEILLDEWDAARLTVPLREAPPQSYPAFFKGFFAGVEFPIAATRQQEDRIILAHRPLAAVAPGEWHESRKAVYGIAASGEEQRAFHRYIERHRPAPKGFHVNYNSWWTSPVPFTEADILGLMKVFEEELYRPYGVALDSFTIDMGWSDPKSLWGIDAGLFPEGFANIQAAAERMGSRLGLWISPSSFYSPALDNEWAKDEGYESFVAPWGGQNLRLLNLGGLRYAAHFRERLADMAGRYRLAQIKLDGYFLGSEFRTGECSSEEAAEGGIAAFEAARAAAPDVWLEATYSAYASPWWLFHVNSVIGSFGDDSPHGRVPAPVYRESYTTARDYYNLQGADRFPSPITAQEILGIIHQSPDDFLNDAVVTVLRGHAFLPLYINPAYMNARRWKSLAELLRWARANAALLTGRPTWPIRPATWEQTETPWLSHDAAMPREAYGYAHWHENGGLVLLRNPWIMPQVFSLVLARGSDAIQTTEPLNIISIYPENRIYAAGVSMDESIPIALAPYETMLLSITPEMPSPEPVSATERIGRSIVVEEKEGCVERVVFEDDREPYGPDWTSLAGASESGVAVTARATVRFVDAEARFLALFEADKAPSAQGSLRIDGVETSLKRSDSALGFAASSVPPEEHWVFLEAELTEGDHRLEFDAFAEGEDTKVSVWIWALRPGQEAVSPTGALPAPEWISLDGAMILAPSRVTKETGYVKCPRPVRSIEGIYLDALEPISATQGWGTLQRNQSVWEKPMTIAGTHFLRGLGTHAPAELVYALDGAYRHFEAWVGLDSAVRGAVTFAVYADGEKRWESGRMQHDDPPRRVEVDISKVKELRLLVGDAGDDMQGDHANWADAILRR